MNKSILLTGSNGFIGTFLGQYLENQNFRVIYTYRSMPRDSDAQTNQYTVGNIDACTQWQKALSNVDVVVHLAARIHSTANTELAALQAFRQVNTQGTLNLARQAVESGVKRFIYLSTIKVNGEQTFATPFLAEDKAKPEEPYAVSKSEAEYQLLELGKKTGLQVVVIRPPLVYGPGVKGNFLRLMQLVNKEIPLPLDRINNQRSLVSITNLSSLIIHCLNHPDAAGEVFLVSDGQDLSTSELFRQLARAMHKRSRLFYLPQEMLYGLSKILKRTSEYERLFGSLQVDILKNKQLLDWEPEQTVEQGIQQAVNGYEDTDSGK